MKVPTEEELSNNKIPKLEDTLLNDIINGNVILFVGAGFSMLGGGPSWKDLAYSYVKELQDNGLISYSEAQAFKQVENPRQLISICQRRDSSKVFSLKNFLSKEKYKEKEKLLQPCYDLCRLGCGVVTTNYDDVLAGKHAPTHIAIPGTSLPKIKDANILNLEKEDDFNAFISKPLGKVFHLHGHIHQESQTVLTTGDYMRFYSKNGHGWTYLSTLFSRKKILFIGFSIGEFEIMENVHVDVHESEHYALFPICEGHSSHYLLDDYKKYYKKNFNINLIEYDISQDGYGILSSILNNWALKIDFHKYQHNEEKTEEDAKNIRYLSEVGVL